MDDFVNEIGGDTWFYVRRGDIKNFPPELIAQQHRNDMSCRTGCITSFEITSARELMSGEGSTLTLQAVRIFSCSSGVRTRASVDALLASEMGLPIRGGKGL